MSHARVSLAPTQTDHPLAEDRRINQGLPPERIRDPGTAPGQVANSLMREERQLASGQRAQAVIHYVKMQALEVGDFARNVKRQDLSLARFGQLVAVGEPFQNKAARGRAVALPSNILMSVEGLDGSCDALKRIPFGIGEDDLAPQLVDERGGIKGFVHGLLPNRCGRDHVYVSAACAVICPATDLA